MFKTNKYRSATIVPSKKPEDWYHEVIPNVLARDETLTAVTRKWILVNWNSAAGSIGVINIKDSGKRASVPKTIAAHTQGITDISPDPFDPDRFASSAADGSIKLWKIPESGLSTNTPLNAQVTIQHGKRAVRVIRWHPSAQGVLASGNDESVKIWDVSSDGTAVEKACLPLDGVESLSWNYNGSKLAITAKDKRLRIYDPRANKVEKDVLAHEGPEITRVLWLGKSKKILTTGRNKARARQVVFFDENLTQLDQTSFEASPGAMNPVVDEEAGLLWLYCRGDQIIKTYEILDQKPFIFGLNTANTGQPYKALDLYPKISVDTENNELARLLLLHNKEIITASVKLPVVRGQRGMFREDLYPDTLSTDPANTAADWFSGKDADPNLESMRPKPPGSEPTPKPGTKTPSKTPLSQSGASSQPSSATQTPVTTRTYPQSEASTPFKDNEQEGDDDEWYTPKEFKLIRSTHYRHIFGKVCNTSQFYTDLRPANNAVMSHVIRSNKTHFAIGWEGANGRIAVFPLGKPGRVGVGNVPIIELGSELHDFDFNPFNDHILAAGGDTGTVKVYNIPKGPFTNHKEPAIELKGHKTKITTIDFHPYVDSALLTSSGDFTLKLWDITKEAPKYNIGGFSDLILNADWNSTGSVVAVASKEDKIRMFDIRQQSLASEAKGLGGGKGTQVCYLGDRNMLFNVGFTSNNERGYNLLDIRNLSTPLTSKTIDAGIGFLTPRYEEEMGVVCLWGKGDSGVQFLEITEEPPHVHWLVDYASLVMQVGISFLPKSVCDVKEVEFARYLKLTQNSVETHSLFVPRTKKEYFQDDIFPPVRSEEATMNFTDFEAGKTELPKRVSLNPGLPLLSAVPKTVKKIKKYKAEEEILDKKQLEEKTMTALYSVMSDKRDDNEVPAHEKNEGVDENEWDDY